ncbi:rho guanine nucleotide exchange factor 10 isoform X1 [Callorhinchus milii]|uniref:rho guanine nucleotide exchange factor 10 isoform X1 n=1 Tax=Callorhinchus milii TaxID=7868 RepID=UPI0004573834|nr:rho guanine nucleotide exchange factor 10 isoform X1 [Callorhinchus milii]|eukprot:gi/632953091/ref/XP_007892216.1/ PREDICTED: rho guanine nucleotide exchange factor 10 isoform X1 [Callorhinchus milii]
MDQDEFPPPPPEVLENDYADDEEEGKLFDFDSDEVPEADRQASSDSTTGYINETKPTSVPSTTQKNTALEAQSQNNGYCDVSETVNGTLHRNDSHHNTDTMAQEEGATTSLSPQTEKSSDAEPPAKANPYSVINITPLQRADQSPGAEQSNQDNGPSSPVVPTGYCVPAACSYAVPSNVPMLIPTYSAPVPIIRNISVDEEASYRGKNCHGDPTQPDSQQVGEDNIGLEEGDAFTRWASDPANTAWLEGQDEVIYDDVPRENSDASITDPEELIYDDVEHGDEAATSSLDYGWSSSEFESYDEQSDTDLKNENGFPNSFLQGKSHKNKRQLSQDLGRLKEHYEKKMKELANAVGGVELQQLKQKQEWKMQQLMKAAREGTKDGLEKTKAAVLKRGRSFIRHRYHEQRAGYLEEEEQNLFIDVECNQIEPVMTPMPEGLTQQQVVRRYILGSIVESEKNYVDALKRILEQYKKPLSEMDPKLLSERKLKMVFYRIKEILQCHCLFQMALASRMTDWDSAEMIGDVFVASFSKSMVLDAYSEYVNNFSTAMGIVKKVCATKPGFLEFLKHCHESSSDRITLYGLMMKPIQRFPQFILLLQDMLKNTPKGHQDRLPLQMALTELETLAEKLNEQKRDADQRCEIKQIAKAMNERYLNKLLHCGSRYLLRSDDMIETVYNEKGEMVKTKERRLFMLNDVLMCATVHSRVQHDGSVVIPSGLRYLLKWSVPLKQVEVVEFGNSEDLAEKSRYPPPHSGEKVLISTKPNKLYMGPGQLYQDLQNLMHDLNVVGQITHLVGNLKGNYQNLNPVVSQDWTAGLQKLILKKEEEIRAADRCRIQLQLPGKLDNEEVQGHGIADLGLKNYEGLNSSKLISGKATFFTAVFNTFTPTNKLSWMSSLQMAKLALEEENQLGWFCAEDDGKRVKRQKHPLLVRHMPVMMSKIQEFKIECAVHNPECSITSDNTPNSFSMGHGYLWIGSCTNQMGQITIVTLHNSNPKVIECFNVESRILSMVYVPDEDKLEDSDVFHDLETMSTKTAETPTICLGMEEGSILVYKSNQAAKKVRLQHFFSPDKSTVMSLTYKSRCLYAGLVNGNISIYTKADDGTWKSESPKVLKLSDLPVKIMLGMEESLWAASGGQVFIINTRTHTVEQQFEAHQEEGMVISHMAVAGVGVWIAFSSGSALRLFHTETLEHLQDVNIATPIHNMTSGQQRVSVTCLLVCHGLLLVGTNLGIIVALPVPRLQGIPKVTGRGMVSYHAHCGPVKCLTMAAASSTLANTSGSATSLSSPIERRDGERSQPEWSGPASTSSKERGVWLGDSSVTVVQNSNQPSSSGSQTSSHHSGSLEHGPEDSTIYELLNEPSLSNKVKHSDSERTKKTKMSSVLVISGAQGHKRMNKKSKPQRQDESVSTVMVWQIPLLNV